MGIPMSLVQAPEYTVDKDKMPEMEIKTGRQEEADAQADYEKERAAMTDTLNAQTDSKVATEKDLADLEAKIADKTAFKEGKETDLAEQEKMTKSINTDCA